MYKIKNECKLKLQTPETIKLLSSTNEVNDREKKLWRKFK